MKIFIQGRKNGNKPLYPKPTPAEFYSWAEDLQRSDAPNNAQCYGKSLYSIAFNGSGCIFTKYIIGYDTLREYIGNIGISIFIAANQKMLGADIKSLLDGLINIYTTNYCPDFKINNQKQEDWLLFSSYANNFDSKVKSISSDENFQYGNKDAAYIFYDNTIEIEKYLERPYQEEYKEYKQILFIDNQSQLLLEIIKHDQKANLTQIVDLENPKYKLIYRQVVEGGLKIDVKVNGSTRHSKSKVKRKDMLTISWEKPYYQKIERNGKWEEIGREFLKIDDYEETIEVLEKSLDPIERKVSIEITDSKGNPITNAVLVCKCKSNKSIPNKEFSQNQNTIDFVGEEQKEKWTISDKRENFEGEEEFIPEFNREFKLTLKEFKTIKLKYLDENNFEIGAKEITFYDDDIRNEQSIPISVSSYQPKTEVFTPNKVDSYYTVDLGKKLIKQVSNQNNPITSLQHENNKPKEKNKSIIYFSLIALFFVCITGIGYYFYDDIFGSQAKSHTHLNNTTKVEELPKFTRIEIESYIEGDSLILENLNQFKTDWEKQTPVIETFTSNESNRTNEKQDSTKFKDWKEIEESLDRAIKKRNAINERNFGFFNDNNNKVIFFEAQLPFKRAINKINKEDYENVKSKLVDVLNLTLTQIADTINKILVTPIEKKSNDEEKDLAIKKSSPKPNNNKPEIKKSNQTTEIAVSIEEQDIIKYLEGSEFCLKKLTNYQKSNKSKELKPSINLAIEFWSLDGSKPKIYPTYFKNVKNDKYLKENNTLNNFLNEEIKKKKENKYPPSIEGYKTIKLSEFIKATK